MQLLRRSDNTPGGLAAELADAKAVYETRRADVIERAATRIEHIHALQRELAEESTALADVVRA